MFRVLPTNHDHLILSSSSSFLSLNLLNKWRSFNGVYKFCATGFDFECIKSFFVKTSGSIHFIGFRYPFLQSFQFFPRKNLGVKSKCRGFSSLNAKMTITILPSIRDGCLIVGDKVVLTAVPENVVVSPVTHGSAFIGATSSSSSSRQLFSLGILE